MDADLTVDCLGMRCPLPIVELARGVEQVPVGAVVALLADDPAARHDVQAWCRMRGQEYVGDDSAEGVPTYLVRRVS